ncbi:MAG: ATP phosphoribosyltransferase [Phycisphaerales bacterium]|jgi:ATP phosphoribosyltransferase
MTVMQERVATATTIKLAIPKGRMFEGVRRLLADGGLDISATERGYRPSISLPGFGVKLLKPRAIVEMLAAGSRDVGFAGADWVRETGADLVEVVDTGLDRVRLVAAAPASLLEGGRLPDRALVVASEYEQIARAWIQERGLDATLLRSYGATEVLPPEDADCIIDNTATGATLAANGLVIIDELMTSSTRLYASRAAMDDPAKCEQIERVGLIVRSVLEARRRVMIEINVPADRLDAVVGVLPCMREPTVSALRSQSGYAVKAAVRREELAEVVPLVKQLGGTDIVVTRPEQIVP